MPQPKAKAPRCAPPGRPKALIPQPKAKAPPSPPPPWRPARPPEGAHPAAEGEGPPVRASAMAPLRATLRGLLGRAGHVLIVLALLSVATFSMLELLPGS